MLSMIGEIIRDLLIFVAVMFVLFIVLLVVVSKMPDDNPLKRILTTLSYRVGAIASGMDSHRELWQPPPPCQITKQCPTRRSPYLASRSASASATSPRARSIWTI